MAIKPHEFQVHTNICEKCQSVDIDNPSTLINCCLLGAPLLRDFLAQVCSNKNKSVLKSLKNQFLSNGDGKIYKSTSEKVKKATLYKSDKIS